VALANPLPKADFANTLRVASVDFRANWNQQSSLTGGGIRTYKDRGPMLWSADVTTVPMTHAEANALMALINSRNGGIKSVLLFDPRVLGPSTDPDGALFGSAAPKVGTITDRFTVAFTDFPANYVIPAGTYIEIKFDTSRYYLGLTVESRTANGSGAVAALEVTPALPAGIETGDAVTVIRAAMKARIVPNSAYPASVTALHTSLRFTAEQDYGA
jgi:hypothetical protein